MMEVERTSFSSRELEEQLSSVQSIKIIVITINYEDHK